VARVLPPKYATVMLSTSEEDPCGMKWSLQGPDSVLSWNLGRAEKLLSSYPSLKSGTLGELAATLKAKVGDAGCYEVM